MESLISNSYFFWAVLALLLLLAEAVTFTSVAFVFSIAAGMVFLSLLLLDGPQSLAGQLLLFAVAALLYPIRRFQKRTAISPTTGDVAASIERAPAGVIRDVDAGGCSGRVLLDHAFLGDRAWMFESETVVKPGVRVRIADVHGNILYVEMDQGE